MHSVALEKAGFFTLKGKKKKKKKKKKKNERCVYFKIFSIWQQAPWRSFDQNPLRNKKASVVYLFIYFLCLRMGAAMLNI